jgi:hypothetical protein
MWERTDLWEPLRGKVAKALGVFARELLKDAAPEPPAQRREAKARKGWYDLEDRRSWIIAVADENGYFPTPEQTADMSRTNARNMEYCRRNPRVATVRDSNSHFAGLMHTIDGVVARKINRRNSMLPGRETDDRRWISAGTWGFAVASGWWAMGSSMPPAECNPSRGSKGTGFGSRYWVTDDGNDAAGS